jgi:integrase
MPHPPRFLTFNNRTLTLDEWAAEKRLDPETIRSRLDRLGWSVERAICEPPDPRFRKGGRTKAGGVRPPPRLREKHGKAFVRWRANGRNYYRSFGDWGSAKALAAHRRFAHEWNAGARTNQQSETLTVGELAGAWLEWAAAEYRKGDRETSEPGICRRAAAKLTTIYGDTPAAEFGPHQLRAVRQSWVDDGLARKTCNALAYRVTRCFGWAVGQSKIPPTVHHALLQVEKLRPGRTAAPDHPKILAVTDEAIAATLAALPSGPACNARSAAIRAMVTVQRLTGMRPQHLCEMRAGNLDRSEGEWVYIPPASGNKTHHLGKAPRFYIGSKAQAAMAPLLVDCPPERLVFGYRKAGGRWHCISRGSYALSIRLACRAAGVTPWHPHQLRHSLATEVAGRTQCLETAAAAIGDSVATAARHYVHLDPQEQKRREIARQYG